MAKASVCVLLQALLPSGQGTAGISPGSCIYSLNVKSYTLNHLRDSIDRSKLETRGQTKSTGSSDSALDNSTPEPKTDPA